MNHLGLTNVYLEKLILPYCKYFKGVYSCDTIPSFAHTNPFSIIINLSSVKEPGSHFVSVFINNGKIIYYDSLGLPSINPHINKFLKQYANTYRSNNMQFQCLNSIFCGYHAGLFIILMDRGMSFQKFLKLYSKNCEDNDMLVVELLKYIFSTFYYSKNLIYDLSGTLRLEALRAGR